jgi:hypothetical protein
MVRYDGAELFPGRGGSADFGWYSFVPDGDLAPGWYVLAVDLRGWNEGARFSMTYPSRENVHFARVQVGAVATWIASSAYCDSRSNGGVGECGVGPVLTQEVPGLLESDFTLRVDGRTDVCAYTEGTVGWSCPFFPDGTVFEIQLNSEDRVQRLAGASSAHSITLFAMEARAPTVPDFGVDSAFEVLP